MARASLSLALTVNFFPTVSHKLLILLPLNNNEYNFNVLVPAGANRFVFNILKSNVNVTEM